jgi:hypothetical protein
MANKTTVGLLLSHALAAVCAAPPPPPPGEGRTAATDDSVGAVVADIWYVPGRALLCGGSAVMAGLVMTLTMGQSYDSASELMHGGCSGPWIVRPADIRQAVP